MQRRGDPRAAQRRHRPAAGGVRDAGPGARAYPRIGGRRNPSIDHRRVKNLIRYFERHWQRVPAGTHLQPGTCCSWTRCRGWPTPTTSASPAIGRNPPGLPWSSTTGTRAAEMDLLPAVPLVAAFRVPGARAAIQITRCRRCSRCSVPSRGCAWRSKRTCVVGRASERGHAAGRRQGVARALPVHGRRRGQVDVEDLGSQNGTFVNGEPHRRAHGAGRRRRDRRRRFAVRARRRLGRAGGPVRRRHLFLGPAGQARAPRDPARGDGEPATDALARRWSELAALARELAAAAIGEEAAQARAGGDGAGVRARPGVRAARRRRGRRAAAVRQSRAAAVSISGRCWSWCAANGGRVLLDDAVEDRELHKARSVVRHGLRSVMVAPVLAGARLRGSCTWIATAAGAYGAGRLRAAERHGGGGGAGASAGPAAPGRRRRRPPPVPDGEGSAGLVGEAPAFREALRLMAAAARVDSTVLITGESGTGKEEMARALHGRSRRAGGAVRGGQLRRHPRVAGRERAVRPPEGGLHRRRRHPGGALRGRRRRDAVPRRGRRAVAGGAGEAAAGAAGAAVLPPGLDQRPARRTCAWWPPPTATSSADVAAGRFREDLFFRLNVLRIRAAAAARAARGHAGRWPGRCWRASAARAGAARCPALDATAEQALARWRWPGNARELGNVLERLLVLREPDDARPASTATR